MKSKTCIYGIHGLTKVWLYSGSPEFTVLNALATKSLSRLLVLAPSPSLDCLQGCCRGELPSKPIQL